MLLALETVTRRGSVAAEIDGVFAAATGDDSRTHGERLPAEIVTFLADHGRSLASVDRFAVVTGPGSFTGLRVGIAAIQGLALPTGRTVAGIPTLDALATCWLFERRDEPVVLVACLDGQRGEVFTAAWLVSGQSTIDDAPLLVQPMATHPEAMATLLGRRPKGWEMVVVGDGGARYADQIRNALGAVRIVQPAMSLAEAAARIAVAHPELSGSPHALRPVYLRRPDAELARERAAKPTTYRLRRADGAEDVAAVEALQRQTFSNPWGAEAIRWELENTDVARLYVMHDEAGQLVAYCACWMIFDELHINSLAVDVTRRRQGLARQLLNYVLAEAARAGASSATLEVRSSNIAARGLYEGMGFAVEGLRRDYYQEPREDAVILWNRTLVPASANRR